MSWAVRSGKRVSEVAPALWRSTRSASRLRQRSKRAVARSCTLFETSYTSCAKTPACRCVPPASRRITVVGENGRREQVLVRSALDLAQACTEQQAMGAERGQPPARPGEAEALVLRRRPLPRRQHLARAGRRIGQDPRPVLFEPLRVAEQPEVQRAQFAGAHRTAEDDPASVD